LKVKGLFVVSCLLLFTLALALPVVAPVSANSSYDKCDRRDSFGRLKPVVVAPKIVFEKWVRSTNGVRFYYIVTAGSKDVTTWSLTSLAFMRTPPVGTSETPYVYNQKLLTLKFEKPIKAGQCREFWFDLKLDYRGFKLGPCLYDITANLPYLGLVKGPI